MESKMKTPLRATAIAVASIATMGSASAWANTTPVQERRVQLKADQVSLAAEKSQFVKDQVALNYDRAHDIMLADSPDSMRVYRDEKAINGAKKDLTVDPLHSKQMRTDQAYLKSEESKLNTAQHELKRDANAGRMSATSPDAEKVYQDKLAIRGQKMALATDKTQLRTDLKR